MVLLHFYVGPILYVILKHALRELENPQRLPPPLKDEHLEQTQTNRLAPTCPMGKPLVSHMVCQKYLIHPNIPIMTRWAIGDKVHM